MTMKAVLGAAVFAAALTISSFAATADGMPAPKKKHYHHPVHHAKVHHHHRHHHHAVVASHDWCVLDILARIRDRFHEARAHHAHSHAVVVRVHAKRHHHHKHHHVAMK